MMSSSKIISSNISNIYNQFQSFKSIGSQIRNLYNSHPKIANSIAGFLTFTAGDIFAQRIAMYQSQHDLKQTTGENKIINSSREVESKIDYKRSIQVGLLGMFMNGVFLYSWYSALDRIIGSSMKSNFGVISKVVADQFIYSPLAIVAFFSFSILKLGKDMESSLLNIKDLIDKKFIKTYIADCAMWPLVNLITFKYISLCYRPSFTAMAQLVWQTYMSTVSNNKNTDTN